MLFEAKKQRYWPQVALTMQLLTIQAKKEDFFESCHIWTEVN